jgi:hypothetical protein
MAIWFAGAPHPNRCILLWHPPLRKMKTSKFNKFKLYDKGPKPMELFLSCSVNRVTRYLNEKLPKCSSPTPILSILIK